MRWKRLLPARLFFLCIFFVWILFVQAEDKGEKTELNEKAVLADYLEHGALYNPGLKAAFSQWKAALRRADQAGYLPDPKFNYTYFVRHIETRVGPQRHRFMIMQKFPWFGKLRYQKDAAKKAAQEMYWAYVKKKNQLFYDITKAYYEYYLLKQRIDLTRSHRKLISQVEGAARAGYKAGTIPYSNLLSLQVELARLADRVNSLESARTPFSIRLSRLINRTIHDPLLPWPTSIPEKKFTAEKTTIMEIIQKNNPDLNRLKNAAQKHEAARNYAGKKYYPDFSIGASYMETGEAVIPGQADSGKDPIGVTLSITIPMWPGKYRAGVREAEQRRTAARLSAQDTGNRLYTRISMSLFEIDDQSRRINLYRKTLLPKARQAFETSRRNFETGKGDFTELIEAERIVLQYELMAVKAVVARLNHIAYIEMIAGDNNVALSSNKTEETTDEK